MTVEAPVVQDERTKELLREYAGLHPDDPRLKFGVRYERKARKDVNDDLLISEGRDSKPRS